MRKLYNTHKSYPLTTTPQRLTGVAKDDNRLGWILQNQAGQSGSPNIYISCGGSCPQSAALQLPAGGNANEDILAPTQELWAWADSACNLTVIEKYQG